MGIIYASSIWVFLIFVCVIAGGAAWMTGQAVASTWRPLFVLAWFIFLLTLATRFLCFALFGEPLLSLQFFIVDYAVLGVIAFLGYRVKRTDQMTGQYRWLYRKTSPFSWALKPGQTDPFAR